MRLFKPLLYIGLLLGPGTVITAADVAEEPIEIRVGFSEVLRPTREVESIVIGNPEVADATVTGEVILLSGKAVGTTNIILLDESEREILSSSLEVVPLDRRPRVSVQVIAGGEDDTIVQYECGPEPGCSPAAPSNQTVTSYTTNVEGSTVLDGSESTTSREMSTSVERTAVPTE